MPPSTVTVRIRVTVPGLLARYTDDQRVVELAVEPAGDRSGDPGGDVAGGTAVDTVTVRDCIGALLDEYPSLRPHLFTDGGAPREHLVFLADGTAIDPIREADTDLSDGGNLVVVQAVSGG